MSPAAHGTCRAGGLHPTGLHRECQTCHNPNTHRQHCSTDNELLHCECCCIIHDKARWDLSGWGSNTPLGPEWGVRFATTQPGKKRLCSIHNMLLRCLCRNIADDKGCGMHWGWGCASHRPPCETSDCHDLDPFFQHCRDTDSGLQSQQVSCGASTAFHHIADGKASGPAGRNLLMTFWKVPCGPGELPAIHVTEQQLSSACQQKLCIEALFADNQTFALAAVSSKPLSSPRKHQAQNDHLSQHNNKTV